MGQNISEEKFKDEFNRFEKKINENSSLPLYLVFLLQINDPNGKSKKNVFAKFQEVVKLLEVKSISKTIRNHVIDVYILG